MLAFFAVLMFGPEKLPGIARKAARVVRYLNTIANDAKGQLRAELGPEWDDVRLSDLNPKTFVQRHLLDSNEIAEVRSVIEESRTALSSSTAEMTGAVAGMHDAVADSSMPEPELATVGSPYDSEAT